MTNLWQMALFEGCAWLAQAGAPGAGAGETGAAEGAAGGNPVGSPPGGVGDSQPYIFGAYAVACTILLLFTLWTAAQTRRTAARIAYLEDRLRSAHPGTLGER